MSAENLQLLLPAIDEKTYNKKIAQNTFNKFQALDDTKKVLQDLLELKYHLEFLRFLEENQKISTTQRTELTVYIAQLENSIQLHLNNLAKKQHITLEVNNNQVEFKTANSLFKTKAKKTAEYTVIEALRQVQGSFDAIQNTVNNTASIVGDINTAKTHNNNRVHPGFIDLKAALSGYSPHKNTLLANKEQFNTYQSYLQNLVTITAERIALLENKKKQLHTFSWFSNKNIVGRGLNRFGSWIAQRYHRTELNKLKEQIELQRANKTHLEASQKTIYQDELAKHRTAFIISVSELKEEGIYNSLEPTFAALQSMARLEDLTAIIIDVVTGCDIKSRSIHADTLYKHPDKLVYLQKLLNFLAEKNTDPAINKAISKIDHTISLIIGAAYSNFKELIFQGPIAPREQWLNPEVEERGFSIIECIEKADNDKFLRHKLEKNEYRQFRLFLDKAKEFAINLSKFTESGENLAVKLEEFFTAEDKSVNDAIYKRLGIEKALGRKTGALSISGLAHATNKILLKLSLKYFNHLPVVHTIRQMIETYVNNIELGLIDNLVANHFELIDQLASENAKEKLRTKISHVASTLDNLAKLPSEEVIMTLFFLDQFQNTHYSPLQKNEPVVELLLKKLQPIIFSKTPDTMLLDKTALILAELLAVDTESQYKTPVEGLLNDQINGLKQFIISIASGAQGTYNIEALGQFKTFIMQEARQHKNLQPYAKQFAKLASQLNEKIAAAIHNYQFDNLIAVENDLRQFLPHNKALTEAHSYVGHLLLEKIRTSLAILATKANRLEERDNLREDTLFFAAKLAAELLAKTNNKDKYSQSKEISAAVAKINNAIIELLNNDKTGVFNYPELLGLRLQFMASLHQANIAEDHYKTVTKALLKAIKNSEPEQLLTLQKTVPVLYKEVHEAIKTKQKELAEPSKQMRLLIAKMNSQFTQLDAGSYHHFNNGINYLLYGEGKLWDRLTKKKKIAPNDATAFLDEVIMPVCKYLDEAEKEAEKNPRLALQYAQVSAQMNKAITEIGDKLLEDFKTLSSSSHAVLAKEKETVLADNKGTLPKALVSYDLFLRRFAFFVRMREKFEPGDNKNRKALGQLVMQEFNETAKTQPGFVTQFVGNMDGATLKSFAPLLQSDEKYIESIIKTDNLVPLITQEGIQYVDPNASPQNSGLLLVDQKAGTNELPTTAFIKMLSHVVLADIYNLKNLSTAQKNLLKEQFQFLIEKLKLEEKQDLERAEYIQKNNGFHTRLLNNLERYTQYCRKSINLIEQRSEYPQADQMILAKAVKDQTIPKEATADQTLLIEASFMLQCCEPMVEKLNRGDAIFDNELLNTVIRDIPGQFITWLERPELTQEEIAKLSARARQELELMPIFTLDDKSFASQVRSLKELLSVIANFAKVLREIVENSADDITGDLQNLLHGQHIKGIANILGYNPTELAQKTRQSLAVPINKAEEPQKQEELLGTATNQSFILAHFDAKLTQQDLITESNLISANPLMESIDMEDVGIADLNDKRQALEERWNELRKTLLPNNLGQAPIPEFAYPKDLTVSSHCFAITGMREGLEKAVKQLEKIKEHHAHHSPERLRIVAFLNGLEDKHIVKVKQEAGTTTYAYIRSLAPSTNKPASSTNRMFSRFAKSPEKIDTQQERDLIQLTELYSQGAYINPQITVLMEQLIKSNNKPELQGIKDNQLSEVMAYLTTEHQKEYFAELSKICGTPEVRISKSANPTTVTRLTEQQIKTDLKTSTENAKKLITNTEQAIFGYFKSGYLGGYDYLKYVQDQATLLRRNLDNNGLNEKECEYYNSLKKQFKWEKSSTYQKRDNSATIYAEILAIKYLIAKCDELPYDFDVSKTAKLGNELNERCADLLARIKLSINNISDTKSTFRANLAQVLQTFQDLSPNNSKTEHKP